MNDVYIFNAGYGVFVISASDEKEARYILFNGDGLDENLSAKEYGYDNIHISDDEPVKADLDKSYIIASYCG